MKLKKKWIGRIICNTDSERSKARAMVKFLASHPELELEDEAKKFNVAMRDRENISMVIEEAEFLINEVAPVGSVFGLINPDFPGCFGYVRDTREAA